MYFPSNLKSYSFLAILYLSSLYFFVCRSHANLLLSAIQGSIVAIKKLFIDRLSEDDKHLVIDIQEVEFMLIVFALTSIRAQALYTEDMHVCICQFMTTIFHVLVLRYFSKVLHCPELLFKMFIGTLKLQNP